jgi:CIC family chloride channel protein
VSNPLRSLKRVPAVGAFAERELGGFLMLSVLVGAGVGLGAAGLILTLRWVSELMEKLLPTTDEIVVFDITRSWVFLTIPVGFLIAWWLARTFAPEVAGDGVPAATEALMVRGGHIRGRVVPLKYLATVATIGLGGSAGREGPIVQIGAGIGSWLSRRFHMGEDQVRSLVAAGAGAGIGAAFNAPIAGMLFAMEVILVSFAPRHMSAIVIASVAAAITSRTLVGEGLVSDFYQSTPSELVLYAVLGILVVVIGFIFLRTLDFVETFSHARAAQLSWLRPVIGGLLVAGLVFFVPSLAGTGQGLTNNLLLSAQYPALIQFEDAWWILILLALGKALATSLTISSGGSGGAFMPSLFMGAVVGAGFARLAEGFWTGGTPLEVGAFAVVGMAAMFAVVARAPLTSIIIVFEVTGARDYGLILPLMLTAVLGTFLAERLTKESVYTMSLKKKGVNLTRPGEVDILDTVVVGSVMTPAPFLASPDLSVAETERMLNSNRSHGVPVVDDGELVGIVTISDMSRASPRETATVGEVMTRRPVTVDPSTPVSRALERMAALGVGRLPVVATDDPRRVVGFFRREEAVRAYHEALNTTTDHHLHRLRLAQRTQPGAGYYDFRVPVGSIADGRLVRDVSWPEGSTLVSVRRDREVIVPTGDTTMMAGDVVTAFGTSTSRQRMIERLNAGAEEATAEIPLHAADEADEGDDEAGE